MFEVKTICVYLKLAGWKLLHCLARAVSRNSSDMTRVSTRYDGNSEFHSRGLCFSVEHVYVLGVVQEGGQMVSKADWEHYSPLPPLKLAHYEDSPPSSAELVIR